MATEIVRVSTPLHKAESSITFHFPECGEKTIGLPFEALGDDAEAIRQGAFRIIEKHGRKMSYDRAARMFSGKVSLTDEEVRHIRDISDVLEKAKVLSVSA